MYYPAQKSHSIYLKLGEEAGIRRLVDTFYDIIEQDEAAADLHRLHLQGFGISHSRREQTDFLCGFFGGPQYYVMKHGHARLRDIHAHMPIGPQMRDLWLACMAKAIAQVGIDAEFSAVLMRHFAVAAEACRNRD